MKLKTMALASVFALTSTLALANTVHHKRFVRTDRGDADIQTAGGSVSRS